MNKSLNTRYSRHIVMAPSASPSDYEEEELDALGMVFWSLFRIISIVFSQEFSFHYEQT